MRAFARQLPVLLGSTSQPWTVCSSSWRGVTTSRAGPGQYPKPQLSKEGARLRRGLQRPLRHIRAEGRRADCRWVRIYSFWFGATPRRRRMPAQAPLTSGAAHGEVCVASSWRCVTAAFACATVATERPASAQAARDRDGLGCCRQLAEGLGATPSSERLPLLAVGQARVVGLGSIAVRLHGPLERGELGHCVRVGGGRPGALRLLTSDNGHYRTSGCEHARHWQARSSAPVCLIAPRRSSTRAWPQQHDQQRPTPHQPPFGRARS
jgi:hypothetical protein